MNSRKKILIVDDEQINLDFFEVMLTKLGFAVDKAQDGLEAIEKVRRFSPDLIILDNIMPRMSGWEVTQRLKGDPKSKNIPIIMLSALNDVKDKIEGFELGVDDYITKPFNFSEVLARIRAALRNRELFGQVVIRESRLHVAEEFAGNVKETIQDFIDGIDELDGAIAQFTPGGLPADEQTLINLAKAMREKTSIVRKRIAELDEKIDKALSELGDLKKDEIGLQALEEHSRGLMGKKVDSNTYGEG